MRRKHHLPSRCSPPRCPITISRNLPLCFDGHSTVSGPALRLYRPRLHGSPAADKNAVGRVSAQNPGGASAVRQGSSEPGISLALAAYSDCADFRLSSYSKNRHRRSRGKGLIRHRFQTVIVRCIAEGQDQCPALDSSSSRFTPRRVSVFSRRQKSSLSRCASIYRYAAQAQPTSDQSTSKTR